MTELAISSHRLNANVADGLRSGLTVANILRVLRIRSIRLDVCSQSIYGPSLRDWALLSMLLFIVALE